MKSITLTFEPGEAPIIEANGYKGCGCTEDTKVFEESLGEVVDRKKKAEMWQVEQKATQKVKAK